MRQKKNRKISENWERIANQRPRSNPPKKKKRKYLEIQSEWHLAFKNRFLAPHI